MDEKDGDRAGIIPHAGKRKEGKERMHKWKKMHTLLQCGHPAACFNLEEGCCDWCEDIERLRETNKNLRAQLEKQAIVLEGGNLYYFGKEIGYLEIRNGSIYCGGGMAGFERYDG